VTVAKARIAALDLHGGWRILSCQMAHGPASGRTSPFRTVAFHTPSTSKPAFSYDFSKPGSDQFVYPGTGAEEEGEDNAISAGVCHFYQG